MACSTSRMATYNNKHWLLSHIRNSFISTDDTGMCETVMMSQDLPSAIQERTIYSCYPGLDQSDDEGGMDAGSYDVQMDQGMGFIQRSNTAQKLDKMNLARKRASKIKNVKCDDQQIVLPTETDTALLFVRKTVQPTNPAINMSVLANKLTIYPKQPQNKFLQYARFDGTAQVSIPTKTIKIWLSMLPEHQRNYPMQVCVSATAKIQEFIGLICYKCSVTYPETPLLSVRNYGLYITEDDGEIDMDFPELDLREPCSKFCFNFLALVERKAADGRAEAARTMSLTSEVEEIQETILRERTAANAQQSEDLARMLGHTTMMEAPLYRSYRLKILMKGFMKSDIQLGISAEKLEIDPVQPQSAKFWSHQKAISHSMDSVLSCELVDRLSSDPVIRIYYCQTRSNEDGSGTKLGSPSSSNGSESVRSYYFITDKNTAHEIVNKIRNIIEVRSSEARRDLLSTTYQEKGKKHFRRILLGL